MQAASYSSSLYVGIIIIIFLPFDLERNKLEFQSLKGSSERYQGAYGGSCLKWEVLGEGKRRRSCRGQDCCPLPHIPHPMALSEPPHPHPGRPSSGSHQAVTRSPG